MVQDLFRISIIVFFFLLAICPYAFASNVSSIILPHHLLAEPLIRDTLSYAAKGVSPEIIVLFGPDHFKAGSIYGNRFIGLDVENDGLISKPVLIVNNSAAVLKDHSISNLLPLIKEYFPNSKVVPYIIPSSITSDQADEMILRLKAQYPENTLVVASVDFSHYLEDRIARFHDIKSIRTIIDNEKSGFPHLEVDCWQALYIARNYAYVRGKEKTVVIGHKTSQDYNKGKLNAQDITSYFAAIFEAGKTTDNVRYHTLLFLGDMMLDRGVEDLMSRKGVYYPILKIRAFLKGIDIVCTNLEGPIVSNPKEFARNSLMFSFNKNVIKMIQYAGINMVTLANNHTLNMGQAGLGETRKILKLNNIAAMGDPISFDKKYSYSADGISYLGFNLISDDGSKAIKTIKVMREEKPNNFMIVNLHWGQEYKYLAQSKKQQELAKKMIDAGADLIIGHHPHVVQGISQYKGKLIFYSLGNFIFDQYFSRETQESLAVGLELSQNELIFHLFPLSGTYSQPKVMDEKPADQMLLKLAKASSPELSRQILSGKITIKR
ncbi:MAG: AmmeMemoRadiSam system protein B [bacterium]